MPADAVEQLAGSWPIVASYGERDRTLAGRADRLERALSELGVDHDVKQYPGAGHSFMNRINGEPAKRGPRRRGMSILSTMRMYLKRTKKLDQPTDIYAHTVKLLDGGELNLAARRGHPTLIVNTASKCGFTPQYAGLQSLHDRYLERGLQVVGFPSADFADQEYGESQEIQDFCQKNYGVAFPLTERISVRADPSPLWQELASQPGSAPPVWNFTKYLIGGDGRLIARWSSKVNPEDPKIVGAIESALT